MTQELDFVDNGIIKQYAPVLVTADADLTHIITVTSAGTPEAGPDKENPNGWILKANPDNTDTVWYMFAGQTKAAKGFPLNAGEAMIVPVRNLNQLSFDADVSGDKVHAAKL